MTKYEEQYIKMIKGNLDFNSDIIKELVDRATPKKIVMLPNRAWKTNEETCPICSSSFVGKFCSNCGQRLKRSE